MPKELRPSTGRRSSPIGVQQTHRSAATWSAADDETLLSARASGLNWQPIAAKHFSNKTANACRKRHERLMERRNREDWDTRKLASLAAQYMDVRKQMWEVLGDKIGERWNIVEAKARRHHQDTSNPVIQGADCTKCMEKGLKNLQTLARAAQRKGSTTGSTHERGNRDDHERDSGIGDSDAEMTEEGDGTARAACYSTSRQLQPFRIAMGSQAGERRQVLPLPLYQPPPSAFTRRLDSGTSSAAGPQSSGHSQQEQDDRMQGGRGVSIQSMLSHAPAV